ncbi:MAG TPA: NrfD/PsrC family molybdoenzyme membrane anchor subunit [Candidatus Limnocylindria bacterium]|jgi:formate-dependent nitrite reductase membrane component NrfD
MPGSYVLHPEWEWPIMLALFIAGVASGTYGAMGLIHFAGDRGDQVVAHRLAFIPLPLMAIVPLFLIFDLGQPGRFLNLVFRSSGAAERGPSPIMFNPNSPMNWGSLAIIIFSGFALVAFVDALHHSDRLRLPWIEGIAHNVGFLAIGELVAIVVSGYSGVLINVTNQGVWSDTFLVGALVIVFSELSGLAVAAIVSDRMAATRTSAAIRVALFGAAVVSAVVLVIFLVSLAADGVALKALVASLLVGPVFWIGVVGAALLIPLVLLAPRARHLPSGRLAMVGVVVLLGALAFRYAMFYSAIAFIQS